MTVKFDCIIIGGGISGLISGIRLAEAGLACMIVSTGMNALHFSSGSIDLLGFHPDTKAVKTPDARMTDFIETHPGHPYGLCGPDIIANAMAFLKDQAQKGGLALYDDAPHNHLILSAMGMLKPTFFSQASMFRPELKTVLEKPKGKFAFINIQGFRDFYPGLIAANLPRHPRFADWEMICGAVSMPEIEIGRKNPHEFRSIDIARIFDTAQGLDTLAARIAKTARGADVIALPAFLGIRNHGRIHARLQELTGRPVMEIPSLPPSIPGLRLDNALKTRFAELGGVLAAGDKVISGTVRQGRLRAIFTENQADEPLEAKAFILASGSFFSGGMTSHFDQLREPVFDLALACALPRNKWYSPDFFTDQGHPFLSYGVKTNAYLNPMDRSGAIIENLFCAGAILANYDPIREATGSGVAVSTAYAAAQRILGEKT